VTLFIIEGESYCSCVLHGVRQSMLKLKRVQILGFKSFCDRTEVQLSGNGIVAIVGPNGCGKSNISDAITWVLGEQSAKSLRGIKMEDVIFAGTRTLKPTGMAEVSLTLVDPEVYDNTAEDEQLGEAGASLAGDWDEDSERRQRAEETEEAVAEAQPGVTYEDEVKPKAVARMDGAADDGDVQPGSAMMTSSGEAAESDVAAASAALAGTAGNVVLRIRRRKFGRAPVRAGEITITRRLFRSGDSEYLLNGKICRLRDIQDIFMGTGLGGESYAIIGQERIGQLLSSKPLDRRAILEEAAGGAAAGECAAEPVAGERHLRRGDAADGGAEASGCQGRAVRRVARGVARSAAGSAGQPVG
jgi:chromosome segregation protein